MSKPRLAFAGGCKGNSGDGGSQSPLDQLIEMLEARGRTKKCHPISALHEEEYYFSRFLSIDLKVEACKKILRNTQPESVLRSRAVGLMMVLQDYPRGYLAMALDDLKIEDFRAWLEPRMIKHGVVVRPRFGD